MSAAPDRSIPNGFLSRSCSPAAPTKTRAALDAELNKIDGKTDPAAEDFRQFAERFEADVLTPATPD